MSQPRVVYAKKSEQARIHTPGHLVPIIVVPDLMATRLTDEETDDLVWNPKGAPLGGDPRPFKVDLERLAQVSVELVPDETHPFELVSQNNQLPRVEHGRSMLLDVYKELFHQLQEGGTAPRWDQMGLERALYFCGYDWRQDNARSALRLADMVEEALEASGGRKVILIGHGMGGQICRYYCRALGGEPKVHQLFLIGCPILGTEGAYAALKHGLEGLYVREIEDSIRSRDAAGVVFESTYRVESWVRAAGSHGSGIASSLFGDIYMLLCLSSGRWLSRAETRTLVRQFPSVYQLVPGAIYCKEHPHWAVFDPMATGIAPAGFMVPFPTMLDLGVETVAALAALADPAAADTIRNAVSQFLGRNQGPLSSRASRNAIGLGALVLKTIDFLGRTHLELLAAYARQSSAGEVFEGATPEGMWIFAAWRAFYGQAVNSLVDCRNPKAFYEDIYTGLSDAVGERPLVSAHLPLAYRFDEVLTVSPREEQAVSLIDVLEALVMTALPEAWLYIITPINVAEAGPGGRRLYRAHRRLAAERQAGIDAENAQSQAFQDKRARERRQPKAYIPPNTYSIHCQTESMAEGGLIQPLAQVSYDDSNEVRSVYVPNFVSLPSDGTVPARSAFPDASLLSRPFEPPDGGGEQPQVPSARHWDLPGASQTTTFINNQINAKLADFLKP